MQTLNGHLAQSGYAAAMQGMSMARPIVIPAGQVLYRFYDSTRAGSPQAGAEGAWWLEFEHFQSIKHFAARHGYALGYAARLFAAILYEWSEVNAYVACRTTTPLSAWKGRGKQIHSTSKDPRDLPTMTPMQSVLEIYQLYVPGLGGAGSLARRALEVRTHAAL
jgi:hypothetical protein